MQARPAASHPNESDKKRKEWRLFIFIVVFFFPLVTFGLVGAMGFSIWMYQLVMGPPGVG